MWSVTTHLPPLMDVARTTLNAKRTAALLVASDYRDVKLPDNAVYELDLASGDCRCLTPGLAYTTTSAPWPIRAIRSSPN